MPVSEIDQEFQGKLRSTRSLQDDVKVSEIDQEFPELLIKSIIKLCVRQNQSLLHPSTVLQCSDVQYHRES